MYCAWLKSTFLRVLKFLEIKEGGLNCWVEHILQNVWIIWSALLYFNLKSSMDPNSLSFIAFQCIMHDSGVLFSKSWNFYKLKKGDLLSRRNHFSRMSELFGPPFCISIWKVFYTKILRHSLHFNLFCMIQEYFSQSLEISRNQRGGTELLGGTYFAECLNYLVPPSVFQF